jgi:hypothetical protein
MDAPRDAIEALHRVLDALDEAKTQCIVVGAWARILYSSPRYSADFDLAVAAFEKDLATIQLELRERGIDSVLGEPTEFGRRLIVPGALEIDLWEGRSSLSRGEFARKRKLSFWGRVVGVVSPEDFVLRKLYNTGLRRDTHDVEDAKEVMAAQWEHFDFPYVRNRAAFYRVRSLFDKILDEVEEERRQAQSTSANKSPAKRGAAHPVVRCSPRCWNSHASLDACGCSCDGANHGSGHPPAGA